MPYLKKSTRELLHAVQEYPELKPDDSGKLAFCLCEQIQHFLDVTPNGGYEGTLAKVLSALEATKIAFIQDVYTPYENIRKMENGPVFNWPK